MTGKLIDPKNTIALIKDRGFSFKKKFGQNFLIDGRQQRRCKAKIDDR